MTETLIAALRRLADECGRDDARALAAPWIWTDETFLWNEILDHGVLSHGGTQWPVSPDNREVIAASRNRLPDLARVLGEAAKRIDLLENLAIQDGTARDQLRDQGVAAERERDEVFDEINVLQDKVQQLTEANSRLEADGIEFRGCPCRHVTPCRDTCSCACMFQSGGCLRCCSFGSLAQRQAKAERMVAEAVDHVRLRAEAAQLKIKLAAMTAARDRACLLARTGYATRPGLGWPDDVRADADQQVDALEAVGQEPGA